MKIKTQNIKIFINIFLILFTFPSCTSAPKEKANKTSKPEKEIKENYLNLEGYNYKMVVENDNSHTENLPLIVVLHSMGSSPDTYMERVGNFNFPCRLIYLKAPHLFENDLTFFPLEPENYYEMDMGKKHEVIVNETSKLSKFIIAITDKFQPKLKPIIIGASQGGDLSYMMGIMYSNLISGAFPLLATLDEKMMTDKITIKTITPIRVFHGQNDSVVKIEDVRKQVAFLKQNKLDVILYEYEKCDHQITEKMMNDYKENISSLLNT